MHDVEQKALVSLDGAVDYSLQDKVVNGKLYVDQGLIAGCAGGGFENICAAADIIKGHYIGADAVYIQCISGKYTDLYGTCEEWRSGRSDGGRNDREDSILRTLLWCRRHSGKQCIFYPSLNKKLPEP